MTSGQPILPNLPPEVTSFLVGYSSLEKPGDKDLVDRAVYAGLRDDTPSAESTKKLGIRPEAIAWMQKTYDMGIPPRDPNSADVEYYIRDQRDAWARKLHDPEQRDTVSNELARLGANAPTADIARARLKAITASNGDECGCGPSIIPAPIFLTDPEFNIEAPTVRTSSLQSQASTGKA